MTPTRWTVLFCLLAVAGGRPLYADEIRWRTEYAAALKEAAEKGQPLLVNVGTEACYWCKQLDQRTFKDEELVKLINERCVPLKVDGNQSTYLVGALRIQSYPTLVFAGPDGSIVAFKEGFLDVAPFKDQLQRVLAAVGVPDWMRRDFDAATRAVAASDYARAMTLFRQVVEDGKDRPIQVKARKALEELEKQAAERHTQAQELANQGKTTEAIEAINQFTKTFPDSVAAREGKQLLLKLTSRPTTETTDRAARAREQLAQAREDYKARQYLCCLDRCETLANDFPDLPEGDEAGKLAAEIKGNSEWARQASEQLGERLCVLYLALADNCLKKGQPQQAIFYLERIITFFPAGRYAVAAQARLTRLRGAPSPPAQ